MQLAARHLSAFCLAVIGGCASAPPATTTTATSEPTTVWYGGTMTVSSGDGATPYGPPKEALVARTVDEAKSQIVEVVVDEGALRSTTLQRDGATNTFHATDEAKSFTGTVTMAGEGWNFSGWSYDLTMADSSGKITGTATIDASGIQTEKYFVAPDGQKTVKIVDKLSPISKAEYDAKLATLLKK